MSIIDQHQEELMAKWERLGGSDAPLKIVRNFMLDPFSVDWSNEIGFALEYLYELGKAA